MSLVNFVPRVGAGRRVVAASLAVCLLSSQQVHAWQPGKDGDFTVAANTAYASLAPVRITTLSTAATAGATTLTLASAAGISSGDVLMVYQAQGATIGSGDTAAYGAVSALGNAGRFEMVSVLGVVGSTVTLSPACGVSPLRFSYASGSQVIRVPQYGNLTIAAGATLSAPQWNGTTGGVMPLLVQNNLVVTGALSASGAGFRGGVLDNVTSANATDVPLFRGASNADGAEKGEGIAGFQAQYDTLNGRYGRGAPANGGGGGNSHNGGGGGGGILVSAGTASGVALFARGGNGGNQLITNDESEGPGGGGGGGFIAAPAALATTVTGGANGSTSSTAVTEFTPNGSTRGGAGNTTTVPALASLPVCATAATIALGVTKTDSITNYTPGGTATYTIVVTNTGTIPAVGTLVDDTLPAGLTLTAPWTCVASAGGSCPASGGAIGGSAVNLTGTVAGASGTLTITVPVAFSANPNDY